jgi:hypothetical protein
MMAELQQQQSSLQSVTEQFSANRQALEQRQQETEAALYKIQESIRKREAEQKQEVQEFILKC